MDDPGRGAAEAGFVSVLMLLLACFLPALRVTKYWQDLPRLAHREHIGFSLVHRSLDEAQAWQLSLSLTVGVVLVVEAEGPSGVGSVGDIINEATARRTLERGNGRVSSRATGNRIQAGAAA